MECFDLNYILSVLMTISCRWTLLSKLDMVDDIHPRCPRMNREERGKRRGKFCFDQMKKIEKEWKERKVGKKRWKGLSE
ncbi:unnamed protein product [Onchocerca flexuosa]|uniref:Uncharacterized protein n=1 Tax=Onchocerca flexuosa TaxID=387005 RepID=A0A183HHI4_9BILA|nr:unnamed protein product [Onchocerca flexuosa]